MQQQESSKKQLLLARLRKTLSSWMYSSDLAPMSYHLHLGLSPCTNELSPLPMGYHLHQWDITFTNGAVNGLSYKHFYVTAIKNVVSVLHTRRMPKCI